MKGDAQIIDLLNELLTAEMTAINQYFIHYRMLEDWGYPRLAAKKREESIEEMKHADKVIARILFLEGIPNMQRLNPVKVGENPIEMHELDLQVEYDNVKRVNAAIAVVRDKGDNTTRVLLDEILVEEEEAVDYLETQLRLVKELGKEHYLAHQMHD